MAKTQVRVIIDLDYENLGEPEPVHKFKHTALGAAQSAAAQGLFTKGLNAALLSCYYNVLVEHLDLPTDKGDDLEIREQPARHHDGEV